MSSAPSNPAAPDANTIGKRRLDATDPNAPQGDSSCISSSIESASSPLLKSSAEEPARRLQSPESSENLAAVKRSASQRSATVKFTPNPQPLVNSAAPTPHQVQLHQLQNHRLEQFGHVMPLKERLHSLQTGRCLSGFQNAARQYIETARGGSAAASASESQPVSRVHSHERQPTVDSQVQSQLENEADPGSEVAATFAALDYEQEAQMRFNLYVEEYTTIVDLELFPLPAEADRGECECDEPCALRSHNDPQYEGSCLWVCAHGNCMVWEDAGIVLHLNGDAPENVSILSVSADSQCDEFTQDKVVVDQLKNWMAAGDHDAVFNMQAELAIELHADAEQTLTRNLSVPECDCKQAAKAVLDKVTGGIFFVCRNRACFFVWHCQEEAPDIGKMDIGQFLGLGESILDKYTNLQYGMRWFGYTYSKRFWNRLCHKPADSDYHHGAFQLDPGDEYSGFLSYRGGSGRWYIQTTLCGEFNTAPGFYFLVVFCPIVALGLSFIPDVCDSKNVDSWQWLVFSDGCAYPVSDRSWFIFRSYGRSILAVIILFWHPIFSWFYRGQKLFIDKYCIHQSDVHGRTNPGVTRLPLFLQHSQKLLVLFDSEYTTRLWCVFELAVYLRLRKDPKVVFISLDRQFLGVAEIQKPILMFRVTLFEQS
jgi:hypothetical protein